MSKPAPGHAAFLRRTAAAALAATVLAAAPGLAQAQTRASVKASAGSGMLTLMSVALPVGFLAVGGQFAVAGIEASGTGTVWVLERTSDGARASLAVAGEAAGAASVGVGTALTATAIASGWVLSTAGQVVAFIPNEVGRALLHHERVSP